VTHISWNVIAWSVLAALVLGLEFLGVADSRFLTITYVLRTYVPGWLLAMVWGWLGWHFLFHR
jgi:hypothetical protein